jgi:nitroreductase
MKSILKKIPGSGLLARRFLKKIRSSHKLRNMSNDELLSLMRHETHRIEKAVYNNIFETKKEMFQGKKERLSEIYCLLEENGVHEDEPTIQWSKRVYKAFDSLEKNFIQKHSLPAQDYDISDADSFVDFLKNRRSTRVWAENQPDIGALEKIARHMIDAARWAPNSGNRQTLRFLILKTPEEKGLLKKIKENHCVNAPLLIFIGMDTRLYGAMGEEERCIYIDAGAAIMQMILTAHACGIGTCWNHLADDLIESRAVNREIYARFAQKLHIPDYIAPIAVVAVGIPEYIPPTPSRMDVENFRL